MAASAQPPERSPVVPVDWVASDRCPDAAYIEAKVARLLAGPAPDTPRLRARAVVVRDKNGPWRVDLSTESATGTGHRSVTAETYVAAGKGSTLTVASVDDKGQLRVVATGTAPKGRATPSPTRTEMPTLQTLRAAVFSFSPPR
jgi:hypothetical protein